MFHLEGAYHQDTRTIPSMSLPDAYWKSSVFQSSSEDALNKDTTSSNTSVDKALDKDDAGSYCKTGLVLVDQEAATKDTVSLQTDDGQDVDKDAAINKTDWRLVTMETSFDSNIDTEITNQKAMTKNFDSLTDTVVQKAETIFACKLDRDIVTQREIANETRSFASEPRGAVVATETKGLVDQEAVTKETKETSILSTVDCPATIDNSIIAQGLEEETAELPNKLLTSGMTRYSPEAIQLDVQFKEAERVHGNDFFWLFFGDITVIFFFSFYPNNFFYLI